MVGGIFYEHSHRLIGAAAGLLTLGLAAALWGAGGWFRWLGLAAVVAVVAQGVLGGLRVVLLEDTLAIVHGSLAQAFFGLLLALQLLLGVGSYLGRFSSVWIPGEQTTMLVLSVAHRLVASLILGATVVLAVWVTRTGPARLERARTSPGRTAGEERSQVAAGSGHPRSVAASPIPGRTAGAERSQAAPGSGRPRSVPASRPPLTCRRRR